MEVRRKFAPGIYYLVIVHYYVVNPGARVLWRDYVFI